MPSFAHSRNQAGQRQELAEHLQQVATFAAEFAVCFQGKDAAFLAGLLHDIGKYNPVFQQYLLNAEAQPSLHMRGPDHKGAGAVLAQEMQLHPLSFLVKGHHGGLPCKEELNGWLRERKAQPEVQAAIQTAKAVLPLLQHAPTNVFPPWLQAELPAEFFLRFLFSALVDADFLDTEQHFQEQKNAQRGSTLTLEQMAQIFEADQHSRFSTSAATLVNQVRAEVYQDCLYMAKHAPGFFRLTVPTGGGKTRSSLAFALTHARDHGQKRIIYAIPHTSITEQTAHEFRKIFPDHGVVLEHHSNITPPDDPEHLTQQEQWSRLAAENWDTPLVVTTTVQLFESLFAHSTSACRKLHHLANSVLILDEVQMLPTHVLIPILDGLRELVAHYHVTVVLCTATQPALHDRTGFAGLVGLREIVMNVARHFAQLKRVEYQLSWRQKKWSWQEVAEQMHAQQQAMTIVNTRADAVKLLEVLDPKGYDPAVFHLSTRMCGAHRRAVLTAVRERLEERLPCFLVSTQLIEAGVDVDFPLVLRALCPLDRIVQAAGRCNREGRLALGQVIVFEPEEGGMPQGRYRTGTQTTQDLFLRSVLDLSDPSIHEQYFEQFYRYLDLDEPKVQTLRQRFDYPAVAKAFRMIEEESQSVVVDYPDPQEPEQAHRLVAALTHTPAFARQHLRQLQPFLVNLRQRELAQAISRYSALELIPGIWHWKGTYDAKRGLIVDGLPEPENLIW